MDPLRRLAISAVVITVIMSPISRAAAQDVLQACAGDIEKFCSQVTPGNGRLLACAYAHEDKLSENCDEAIGEAADQLDWFMAEIGNAIDLCATDIEKHCAAVVAGQGRIYQCLKEKQADIGKDCSSVVDTVTARLAN